MPVSVRYNHIYMSIILYSSQVLKHYNALLHIKKPESYFLSGFAHLVAFSSVKHYFFLKNSLTGTPVNLKFWRN